MPDSSRAGSPAPLTALIDVARVEREHYARRRAKGDGEERLVGGWPSGTENIYKIHAESFRDTVHLDAIVGEVQRIVDAAIGRD